MRRHATVLFSTLAAASVAIAAAPFDELCDRYAGVQATHATMSRTSSQLDVPGVPVVASHDIVVRASGAFRLHTWAASDPQAGADESARPWYFVYYGSKGGDLISARPPGEVFYRSKPAPDWTPVQHIMAPWPLIEGWIRDMERDGVAPVRDGAAWRACHDKGTVALCLTWNAANGVLLSAEYRYRGGLSHALTFSEFTEGSAFPARATEQLTRPGSTTREPKTIINNFAVAVRIVDEAEAASATTFDQRTMRVNYFDSATGNVISPEGEVLFNEHRLLAALDRGAAQRRSVRVAWIVGVVLAVLASGFIVWKRLKPT